MDVHFLNEKGSALLDFWEKEMAQFIEFVKIKGLKNGILKIEVSNPVVKQELFLHRKGLIKKMNERIGENLIKEIRFFQKLK